MKINQNIPIMETTYNGNINFIQPAEGNMKVLAIAQLKKLEAEGKTVIITDPYLFNSGNSTSYSEDLKAVLLSLSAKYIMYCFNNHSALYNEIKLELQNVGCTLSCGNYLQNCHDRFWICPESDKAVVFGTSLNGLCKSICRVDELNDEEVYFLKNELHSRGII